MDTSLLAVLKVCDSQNGRYPAAPSLAAGMSLIAIGLPLIKARLEKMVAHGERLPPEADHLANALFGEGTILLSMLHRLTISD